MTKDTSISINGRRWRLVSPQAIEETPDNMAAFSQRLRACVQQLPDYRQSIRRLADAVQNGETIGISSDYDCDGNCSLALMIRTLRACGVTDSRIIPHVPNRFTEGYGINDAAVKAIRQKGASLLLTLDNGTLAHRPLAQARAESMDVIVIDHHPNQASERLPAETYIVNANRTDAHASAELKNMAAVGVSYVVAQGLVEELIQRGHFTQQGLPEPDMRHMLGLVALATVADVVNVRGWINRFFIQEGLNVMREGLDPILSQLCEAAHVPPRDLTEEHLAFVLGPMINAPGRLNRPDDPTWHNISDPWRLLSSSNLRAPELVTAFLHMRSCNEARKALEALLHREAQAQAKELLRQHPQARVLVVGGAGKAWHPGIVGIVASRLMEEFGLPTVVAAYDPSKQHYKMSARSLRANTPEGLLTADIGEAFRYEKSQHRLAHGGGHPFAAGATLESPPAARIQMLDAFRQKLELRLASQVDRVKAAQRTEVADVINFGELKPCENLLDQPEVRERALRHWLRTIPREKADLRYMAARLCGGIRPSKELAMQDNRTEYAVLDDLIERDIGTARAQVLSALQKAEPDLLREKILAQYFVDARSTAPFGEGHRPPLYAFPGMVVKEVSESANGRHLMLTVAPLDAPQLNLKAQAFHVSPALRDVLQSGQSSKPQAVTLLATLDVSYSPRNGRGGTPETLPRLRIEDVALSHRHPIRRHALLSQILEGYTPPPALTVVPRR